MFWIHNIPRKCNLLFHYNKLCLCFAIISGVVLLSPPILNIHVQDNPFQTRPEHAQKHKMHVEKSNLLSEETVLKSSSTVLSVFGPHDSIYDNFTYDCTSMLNHLLMATSDN